jgi:hypothetical protein
VTLLGFRRGSGTDMANLLLTYGRMVRAAARCEVLLGATTERLLIEDGQVWWAQVVTSEGERRQIRARSTLRTGGFGGDPELRARALHPPPGSRHPAARQHVQQGRRLRL